MQRPSVDLPQPDSPDEAERLALRDRRGRRRRRRAARPAAIAAQTAPRPTRAAGSACARPRTSSSGSATGDHRLAANVRDARLVVDARGRAAAPSGRSGNSPAHAVRPARTGSADGSGSRTAARRGRAASAGDRRERLADDVEVRHRAQQARACTDGAAPGRPRRSARSRPPAPAYITATLLARLGDHGEVVRDEDDAHAEPSPAGRAAGFRIWSWIVTSSAVVGSSQRRTLRLAGRARSRSSRAAAGRPRARAGRPRPPLRVGDADRPHAARARARAPRRRL